MWWLWIIIGSGIFFAFLSIIIMLVRGYLAFIHLYTPQVLQYYPLLEAEKISKEKEKNSKKEN